jgi:excisionase family DNA binding protein
VRLLLSTKESWQRLGIGKTMFFELLKDGKITAVRLNGRTLIEPAELERLVAALPRRVVRKSEVALGDGSNQAGPSLGSTQKGVA